MIIWNELRGLAVEIERQGYIIRHKDGVSYTNEDDLNTTDDIVVQAIVDSYNELPHVKLLKIEELKAEGLSRINLIFPAIKNWDDLDLVREQWLSIAPAARQATVDFQSMIDTFQAGKDAAVIINAFTTILEVDNYNVATDPAWP